MSLDTQDGIRPVFKENRHLYVLVLALFIMMMSIGYDSPVAAGVAALLSVATAIWHFWRR